MNAHALVAMVAAGVSACLIISLILWHVDHFAPSLYLDMVFDAMAAARLDTLDYLFSTHNEHVIATSRLLFIVDRWVGDTGFVSVVAGYFMQLAVALALGTFAWRELTAVGRSHALVAVVLIFALTLNGSQLQVLTWGLMVQHIIMNVVIVSAALLTCRLLLAEEGAGFSRAEYALWCVVLLGLLTLGNGAAVPLAGFVLALLCRASPRLVLHFSVQCIVVIGVTVFLRTRSEIGLGGITRALDWQTLPQHLQFSLATVGGPLLRGTPWPSVEPVWPHAYPLALAIGAGIALLSLVQAYRVFVDKPGARGPLGLVGLYLLIIAFGTALAASLSRIWLLGPEEALTQKYSVFTCMAWIGALLVLCQWLLVSQLHWRRYAFSVLALVLLLSINAAQQREMRIFAKWSNQVWEGSLAVLLGVDDRPFLHTLYPHYAEFGAYVEQELEPAQGGVFHLLDVRYGDRFDIAPRALPQCEGSLETLVVVPDEDRAGALSAEGKLYRFKGYSHLPDIGGGARDVIALDPTGNLVGYGRNTRPAPELLDATNGAVSTRYFGFARVTESARVDFVARGSGGACRVGTWEL